MIPIEYRQSLQYQLFLQTLRYALQNPIKKRVSDLLRGFMTIISISLFLNYQRKSTTFLKFTKKFLKKTSLICVFFILSRKISN